MSSTRKSLETLLFFFVRENPLWFFLSKNTAKKYGVSQPGEMPSPEKVRKSARVEENNEEEDQVFDAPNAQDEAV